VRSDVKPSGGAQSPPPDGERTYLRGPHLFVCYTRPSLACSVEHVTSTKLLDNVFKCYSPSGDGLTFGKGLSPFAIICPGHNGIEQVRKLVQQAQIVEAGTCTTLADAATIISEDVRFPMLPFVAVEKLLWVVHRGGCVPQDGARHLDKHSQCRHNHRSLTPAPGDKPKFGARIQRL
jgi:hypothetical protein